MMFSAWIVIWSHDTAAWIFHDALLRPGQSVFAEPHWGGCPRAHVLALSRLSPTRLWFPGARAHPFNDLRYVLGGFAYLQDMLDHGIIRAHTSASQPLGVFLQQMPYPCYVNDVWVQGFYPCRHDYTSKSMGGLGWGGCINVINMNLGALSASSPTDLINVLISYSTPTNVPKETIGSISFVKTIINVWFSLLAADSKAGAQEEHKRSHLIKMVSLHLVPKPHYLGLKDHNYENNVEKL